MTVGGIISAIVVGLIIGALGRLVVPGKQNIPIWLTIVIGIVAALIGTAIARGAGWADTDGVDWIEIAIQVVLAAIGVWGSRASTAVAGCNGHSPTSRCSGGAGHSARAAAVTRRVDGGPDWDASEDGGVTWRKDFDLIFDRATDA
ncbi:hypothetical protein GCM10027610_028820 [Dactylosporangium cerinum]